MQEGFYEKEGLKLLDALPSSAQWQAPVWVDQQLLDIAKIESGQFTLNVGEYALEGVETVRSATEPLAKTKKLALRTNVARSLPIGLPRRLRSQIHRLGERYV